MDNLRLAQDLTSVGIAVEGISGEGENAVFEMEIGTNRPDAMNHYGVAREASVIYNLPLPAASNLPAARRQRRFQLSKSTDKSGCARYTARVVRDVTIKASPDAIAKRLMLVDQRPINNAADATNYTLWEMGHPTHVFDLDLLEGGKILVRRAFSGETLKTLDGVERKLTPEDLVIADAVKPVALAGVMGGFDTMITEKTRNILIESAWFDPATIRKSSRRHGCTPMLRIASSAARILKRYDQGLRSSGGAHSGIGRRQTRPAPDRRGRAASGPGSRWRCVFPKCTAFSAKSWRPTRSSAFSSNWASS